MMSRFEKCVLLIVGSVFALVSTSTAGGATKQYAVNIKVEPWPGLDPVAETKKTMEFHRRHGLGTDAKSERWVRTAAEAQAKGYTYKSRVVVHFADTASFVRVPVPGLSNGAVAMKTEVWDGKYTLRDMVGQSARIFAGDQRQQYRSIGDQVIIAGYVPRSAIRLVGNQNGVRTETFQYVNKSGTHQSLTLWKSKTDNLMRAESKTQLPTKTYVDSRFTIAIWDESGAPIQFTVKRYLASGRLLRTEKYEVERTTGTVPLTIEAAIVPGDRVFDMRKSEENPAEYEFVGKLPDVDDLESGREWLYGLPNNTTRASLAYVSGGVVLIAGVIVRSRFAGKKSKKS